MTHTPHELIEEFPHHVETIHALKVKNVHFAQLAARYHDVNRAIHRAESDIEPTDDLNLEAMKKQRLVLKDEIWGILRAPA